MLSRPFYQPFNIIGSRERRATRRAQITWNQGRTTRGGGTFRILRFASGPYLAPFVRRPMSCRRAQHWDGNVATREIALHHDGDQIDCYIQQLK